MSRQTPGEEKYRKDKRVSNSKIGVLGMHRSSDFESFRVFSVTFTF